MKKIIATMLTLSSLFVMGGQLNAGVPEKGTDNGLIDYIEANEINSYEEFLDVIEVLSPDSVDANVDIDCIVSFDIDVDYENMVVIVTTMRESTSTRATGASNSASKSYYSSGGQKLFTITVNGSFSFASGSCTTTAASGTYNKASLSIWTSSPSVSRGNINSRIAYARIYGTATNGVNSMNYSLTLTCNDSGSFTSY